MAVPHLVLFLSQASIAGGIALTSNSPKWFPTAQKVEQWVSASIGTGILLQWVLLLHTSASLERIKAVLLKLPPQIFGLVTVLTILGFLTSTAILARKLLDASLPEEEIAEGSEKMTIKWGRPLSPLPWLLVGMAVMDLALLAFCRSKALSLLSLGAASYAFWKISRERFVKMTLEIPNRDENPQSFRISLLFRDFGWIGEEGECSICLEELKDKPLLSPCGDRKHAVHRECAANYVVANPEEIVSSLKWKREVSSYGSVNYRVKLEKGRACCCVVRDPCPWIEVLVRDQGNWISATVEK